MTQEQAKQLETLILDLQNKAMLYAKDHEDMANFSAWIDATATLHMYIKSITK